LLEDSFPSANCWIFIVEDLVVTNNPIIKSCPFRGWGLGFIGMIHPSSLKGHRFVLVATDYFTKWSEAIPLRNMTHKEVIQFITEHITHRLGIPRTLTTDQGSSLMAKEVKDFYIK
jgi:hypothetical protein